MDEVNEPQLYSSTARLVQNDDRALAAQLAQSIGLITDWHLVRYHPKINCTVVSCIFMILLQVGLGVAGYFLPRLLGARWLLTALVAAMAVNFLCVLLCYVLGNRFLVGLKVRGYLLVLPPFRRLRRAPMVVGCLYAVADLLLLSVVHAECPAAMRDPANLTCEGSEFLQQPYWLLLVAGVVGEGALLICAYALLALRLTRFHLRARRGRVLPDVLSELAELNVNAGLGVPGLGTPSGRPPTESTLHSRGSVPADRQASVPPGTSPDVVEVHSRIVDIIDRPGSVESLSRVIMERQADLLFYMHQRIECLQEELSQLYRNQQAA